MHRKHTVLPYAKCHTNFNLFGNLYSKVDNKVEISPELTQEEGSYDIFLLPTTAAHERAEKKCVH